MLWSLSIQSNVSTLNIPNTYNNCNYVFTYQVTVDCNTVRERMNEILVTDLFGLVSA